MDPVRVFGFPLGPEDTVLIPYEAFKITPGKNPCYRIPEDIPLAINRDEARFNLMNNPAWDKRRLEYREFKIKELEETKDPALKKYWETHREQKPDQPRNN